MLGRFPPLLPAGDVFRGRTLVLSPHADDEVIAVGGTLALLRRQGIPVRVLHLTDGSLGDPEGRFNDLVTLRREEGRRALALLDVETPVELGFPDGGLTSRIDDLVRALAEQIRAFTPLHLVSPSPLEAHLDHRACAEALRRVLVDHPGGTTETVFFFGVNTPVVANLLIDITPARSGKERALRAYRSQAGYTDLAAKVGAMDAARTVNIDQPEVVACEALIRLDVAALAEFFAAAEAFEGSVSRGTPRP